MLIFLLPTASEGFGQSVAVDADERVATFRFVAGDDMFYIPGPATARNWNGSSPWLTNTGAETASGRMPAQLDGYCTSLPPPKENLTRAFVRTNRIESKLILHKGYS